MADLTWNFDIWTLPVDTQSGRVTGEPVRLTDSLTAEVQPAISGDGRFAAYVSRSPGQTIYWLHDFATGKTNRMAYFPDSSGTPFLNANGSQFLYTRREGDKRSLFIQSTAGGLGQRLRDDTGMQTCWTPSGRIVYNRIDQPSPGINRAVAVLDLRSHSDRILLEHDRPFYQVRFSPDESMIAFMQLTTSQTAGVTIAPASGAWPIPKTEWIPVTDGTQWDDKPNWSPDGGLVYFTSERDGYRCLWSRRIDPKSHRPIGELISVRHFHSSRRSLSNIGLSPLEIGIARDKIVFAQGEVTGNIWLVRSK
jgi:Tol biopolymer transport system component